MRGAESIHGDCLKSFGVVAQFEEAVAAFAGSSFAVAVNTGTSAIFLALKYIQEGLHLGGPVVMPARTFVSVPMAVLQAGFQIAFDDYEWSGVYKLDPHLVVDGALRFRKNMYEGGLHCLSFQARKLLNIGEGGMILTDDERASEWLKRARYWGRGGPTFAVEDIDMIGWQAYMTPEKAARGLHLMEYIAPDLPDQVNVYPDLRKVKAFQSLIES